MVKYEPRTHRGSRDMHRKRPLHKRVDNRIGAHTHYPTNRGLLMASSRRETRFPRVSDPQAPLGALSRTSHGSRRGETAFLGPKSLT